MLPRLPKPSAAEVTSAPAAALSMAHCPRRSTICWHNYAFTAMTRTCSEVERTSQRRSATLLILGFSRSFEVLADYNAYFAAVGVPALLSIEISRTRPALLIDGKVRVGVFQKDEK